jgi:hypothetical protein
MNAFQVCAVTALLLAAPIAAFAQSADTKYCEALGDKYQDYVQATGRRGEAAPSVTADIALSKCQTAPGEAIPVLEKSLTDGRVTLPRRN